MDIKMGCKVFFWILLLFLIRACEGVKNPRKNVKVPAFYAFGDSFVDQGNNNHLVSAIKANFWPYGKDFPGGRATGRFSNGKTAADVIAEGLGIKDLLPAYLDPHLDSFDLQTGVSFASGGCAYNPLVPELLATPPLSRQFEQFENYTVKLRRILGEGGAKYTLANSIYLLSAGSNDLAYYYTVPFDIVRRQYDNISSYIDIAVASALKSIQEMYRLGARRLILTSVLPVGCVPTVRTVLGGFKRTCSEEVNQAAQMVNAKLFRKAFSLAKRLPELKLVFFDIYKPAIDMISNPGGHGFEVVDRGCCGTGDFEFAVLCNKFSPLCSNDTAYLFWDGVHLSERASGMIARQFLEKHLIDVL